MTPSPVPEQICAHRLNKDRTGCKDCGMWYVETDDRTSCAYFPAHAGAAGSPPEMVPVMESIGDYLRWCGQPAGS